VSEAGKLFPFHLPRVFGSATVKNHNAFAFVEDKTLPLDAETVRRLPKEKAIFQTLTRLALGVVSTSPTYA
jgi:hypothetical protein